MNAEWKEYRLGDLTDWYSGGTPSKKRDEYWNGDIPWISASSMYGSRYSDSKLKITEEGLKAGSKLVPEDTVLLLVRGSSLHQRIPVGISLRPVSFNQDVKGIRIKDNVLKDEILDPWFLLYWLISQQYNLLQMVENTGIGAGKFDTKQLQDLILKVPDKEERKLIVATAKNIDDKIELNRRINQTLEQIAQAVFKSWFVDFEPVKAKIEARENGRNPERAAMCAISGKTETELQTLPPDQLTQLATTAALFPDKLAESELGMIPKGWSVGDLNSFCKLNKNSWTKKNAPEDLWYVDLANTKNGYILKIQNFLWGESPSRACRILTYGDTIIGTVRPGNRSFALIGKSDKVLTGSTGFAVLTPKKNYYREITYFIGAGNNNLERLTLLADGAAYPAVRPDVVTTIDCIIPNLEIIKGFSQMVAPLLDKMDSNNIEQTILSQLRDTLLPKLLSGEITVAETQAQIEAAV